MSFNRRHAFKDLSPPNSLKEIMNDLGRKSYSLYISFRFGINQNDQKLEANKLTSISYVLIAKISL